MDLLHFITAGSVDDGKSTLIGRLLHDCNAILEDQLLALQEASRRRGDDGLNLALLTDGLRAEREQGITIDVAYRYFSTPKRKFIIADCPGHFQYTRNMVTGASRANLAIVLVDAEKGIVEQTRRHCFVASLLQIPHLVICVNKMDTVNYSQEAFERVRLEFNEFSKKLDIHDVVLIPISALNGDNVVTISDKMDWYTGRSLLNHLEEVHIANDTNYVDFRFIIQKVLCPLSKEIRDYRGYAGWVASGSVREGDEIIALPSGFKTRVKTIEKAGHSIPEATASQSVVIRLENELDIGRGDMIVRPNNQPQVGQNLDVALCWMDSTPLDPNKRYILRHTTSEAQAIITEVTYKFDINTLSRQTQSLTVGLNDFARVKMRTSKPILFDKYRLNRATGSLILIDDTTGSTCAAGMIN